MLFSEWLFQLSLRRQSEYSPMMNVECWMLSLKPKCSNRWKRLSKKSVFIELDVGFVLTWYVIVWLQTEEVEARASLSRSAPSAPRMTTVCWDAAVQWIGVAAAMRSTTVGRPTCTAPISTTSDQWRWLCPVSSSRSVGAVVELERLRIPVLGLCFSLPARR